ncbi:hypothetical protein Dtox_1777 [Desulfofarcimen acetoxidans DSM 771]|uniref:Ferric oxidoreductase domain-containing protein n=1 Tax=Desulfofarcimen acetoxidans (strain ATCC 49208 / DSM 771 / KCTC 5769 / VKM B-1644 / 5575) TaxID=485916 RepID=C8VX54_DESAS|nr:hypothetical protein [Desulfofarcimen acetoxidans]ACV62630.1 hypothetical protein Dtox_1777 [Desulfofarcimen acetoxidans DSM 771]
MRQSKKVIFIYLLTILLLTCFSNGACIENALAGHGWQHQNSAAIQPGRTIRETGKSLGSFAAIFFIISLLPYLLRQHVIPNLGSSNQHKAKQILRWLNKHHYFAGVIAVSFALVHGLTMLLTFPFWNPVIWLGLLSLILLLIASVKGIFMKTQYTCSKDLLRTHKLLALLTGLLTVIHISLT